MSSLRPRRGGGCDCDSYNLREPERQKIIQMLLVGEVVLTICALGIVAIAGYLKYLLSVSTYVAHVMNLAEGNYASNDTRALDFIISVGVISVALHFMSIKIWADTMHRKRRLRRKQVMYWYQFLRLGFVAFFISAPIVSKYQQGPLLAAFEMAETEVGIKTKALDIVFANYFTWFLTAVTLIEVSKSSNKQLYTL